jgi:hypothetical protein
MRTLVESQEKERQTLDEETKAAAEARLIS